MTIQQVYSNLLVLNWPIQNYPKLKTEFIYLLIWIGTKFDTIFFYTVHFDQYH